MKKSGFIAGALFSTIFLSANAAAAPQDFTTIFTNAFSVITGVLAGAVNALVAIPANILMFLLVFMALYWSAMRIFHKKGLALAISLIASLLGISMFWQTGNQWLSMITTSYGAVAIAIVIFIPMILFWYFSLAFISTPLYVPMWITAGVCFFLISVGKLQVVQGQQDASFAWLAMVAAVVSFIIIFYREGIEKYHRKALYNRRGYLHAEIQRLRNESRDGTINPHEAEERISRIKGEIAEIDSEMH